MSMARGGIISVVIAFLGMLCLSVHGEDDLSLLKAAHRGNTTAMRRIGMRMYRGCSRGNPSIGIKWLERAESHGDVESMYFLGRIYDFKKNTEKARMYLEKAARHGHEKARSHLQKMGIEVGVDRGDCSADTNADLKGKNDEIDSNVDALADSLERKVRDFPLVYEYECTITDDYQMPEDVVQLLKEKHASWVKIEASNSSNDGGARSCDGDSVEKWIEETGGREKARTVLRELGKRVYQKLPDKAFLKRALIMGALIGCDGYVGPWQVCMLKAEANFNYTGSCGIKESFWGRYTTPWHENAREINGKPHVPNYEVGVIDKGSYGPGYKYECSISWKDGLPYKVRCKLDFSPSLKYLVKKEGKK